MKDLFPVDFREMFRSLGFSILGTAFIISLFFIAYGLVFNLVTSNPDKVKGIIERSSLYSDLPAVLYDEAAQRTGNGQAEIPLKDAEIRRIALDVYNPQFVQKNLEKLIDGIYAWLEGSAPQPEVTLDFTEQNADFAKKLGKYVKTQTAKLPACSPEQSSKLRSIDVLKVKCLPPTTTPAELGKQTEKNIVASGNSLLENKFSTMDIKTIEDKPFAESFSDLPNSFALAKTIPIALIVFALVLMVTIFYISKDKIKALKRISRSLLLAGILITLTPLILVSGTTILLKNSSDNDQIKNIVSTLFEEFIQEASKVYYTFGILLILAGVGVYVYLRKSADSEPKAKAKKKS